MKVICVGIPKTNVNINLELGKVYDAFLLRPDLSNYWCVRDSLGNIVPCDFSNFYNDVRCFITLSEFREIKLKELGI
jgi:hypothetical protein